MCREKLLLDSRSKRGHKCLCLRHGGHRDHDLYSSIIEEYVYFSECGYRLLYKILYLLCFPSICLNENRLPSALSNGFRNSFSLSFPSSPNHNLRSFLGKEFGRGSPHSGRASSNYGYLVFQSHDPFLRIMS